MVQFSARLFSNVCVCVHTHVKHVHVCGRVEEVKRNTLILFVLVHWILIGEGRTLADLVTNSSFTESAIFGIILFVGQLASSPISIVVLSLFLRISLENCPHARNDHIISPNCPLRILSAMLRTLRMLSVGSTLLLSWIANLLWTSYFFASCRHHPVASDCNVEGRRRAL